MGVNLDAVFRKAEAVRNKEATQKQQQENEIPIALLDNHPLFGKGLPFREPTQERLDQMAESIRRNGILNPLLVRRMGERYQILGGHTRKAAAAKIGYKELPCVVMDVDDDEAENIFVTDNLMQRPGLLPSEKAWAYRTKLEAMKRQAGRPPKQQSENSSQVGMNLDANSTSSQVGTKLDLDATSAQLGRKFNAEENSTQLGRNLETAELIAKETGESRNQIRRYIRLTYLNPDLLDLVDDGKLGLTIAVELSYLDELVQSMLADYLEEHPKASVSKNIASQLRDLAEAGTVTALDIEQLFREPEQQRAPRVLKLQLKPIRKFFPASASPEQMTAIITAALERYYREEENNGHQ